MLDLSGYLALPGLINSHDHLEMNLFPRLGKPPYPNFYAWAKDIYHPERSPIREILQVSLQDRLWWGAYKNLISGVTTVVHHNPFYRRVFNRWFPVKVVKNYAWSHSLGFGNNLVQDFQKSRAKPYIIHAAEGADTASAQEIDALERMGVLGQNTVIVHGISATDQQIQRMSKVGVSLVWCPASNQFLYGKNAPISKMKNHLQIALGTDSTMSGSPTLLDEMRLARDTGMASPAELLEMVTTNASAIFNLQKAGGVIREGIPADLLLLPDRGKPVAETLLNATSADIALLMVDGAPRLADTVVAEKLGLTDGYVLVEDTPKWIYGDMVGLKNRVWQMVGKEILSKNRLWERMNSVAENKAK